jgi:effector-binding domain-containing protein
MPLRGGNHMVVDFELARAPKYRVASITRKGPWKNDNLRAEFAELTKWAAKRKVKTGKWIFREPADRVWEACLELKGRAEAEGRIKVKTLRAAHVAHCVFDPEEVSPRVVYHGLNDWLRWQKKDGKITGVGSSREVYAGDPWKDKKAWAHAEVQFVVRKK